jgi:hypothetical protein
MPPYRRLIPASSAAALIDAKFLARLRYLTSTVSLKENSLPKIAIEVVAAAADITLCPLVYSGKGGV